MRRHSSVHTVGLSLRSLGLCSCGGCTRCMLRHRGMLCRRNLQLMEKYFAASFGAYGAVVAHMRHVGCENLYVSEYSVRVGRGGVDIARIMVVRAVAMLREGEDEAVLGIAGAGVMVVMSAPAALNVHMVAHRRTAAHQHSACVGSRRRNIDEGQKQCYDSPLLHSSVNPPSRSFEIQASASTAARSASMP